MKEYKYQNHLLLLAFSIVSTIGILNHEIWLDEAQNWLQARDNNSMGELFESIRYEGHPMLWNLLLFFITRITHNVLWMQILHLFIIIITASIFIFYSPFSFIEKILFVFGYFICFEYAVIARNYSLIILFLFLFGKYYQENKKNYLILSFLLAMLANTHLLGLILSASIALKLAIDIYQNSELKINRSKIVLGIIIFCTGIVASIIQILPPGETPILVSTEAIGIESLTRIVPVFVKAFIPIPDVFNYHFWNTNLIISFSKVLASFISVLLFFIPLLFLNNKKVWLFIYYSCTLFIFGVFIVIKLPAVRYAGMVYIFFIFCLWLSSCEQEKRLFRFNIKQIVLNRILILLLVVQVVANVAAYSFEIARPFSESKNVASYLKQENLLGMDILGEFCESSMFLTYIDKEAYYLDLKQTGSYCHLKEGEAVYFVDLDTILKEAVRYTAKHKADALFIHYQPIDLSLKNTENLVLIKSFTNSVVNNENFYIYRVQYNPSVRKF